MGPREPVRGRPGRENAFRGRAAARGPPGLWTGGSFLSRMCACVRPPGHAPNPAPSPPPQSSPHLHHQSSPPPAVFTITSTPAMFTITSTCCHHHHLHLQSVPSPPPAMFTITSPLNHHLHLHSSPSPTNPRGGLCKRKTRTHPSGALVAPSQPHAP